VVAVVGVDTELVDDLEVVLAPILDVDEGVGQRGAVVAGEIIALAEDAGGGENVGGDELVEETLELAVGEADAVEGLKFLAEVFPSAARSRMSVRWVYFRPTSFSMNWSSSWRSDVVIPSCGYLHCSARVAPFHLGVIGFHGHRQIHGGG
jgi:hypothetical protein